MRWIHILSTLLIPSWAQVQLFWLSSQSVAGAPLGSIPQKYGSLSEQVNGPLTPHRLLAWLIRHQSSPWFPSLPLYTSSQALYFCQMVSMQSWEQRKIKGRLQRLENQESTAVISCCSDDTFTGSMHSMLNNPKRECKWENTPWNLSSLCVFKAQMHGENAQNI